jgi:hypothetical protein
LISRGLELRAIFRGEDLGALQIFFGVNVIGFFLLRLLAGTFLFGGFRDILCLLVLRAACLGVYQNAREN